MRLNLGCGRAQFPTTEENPFTRHLYSYLEAFCHAGINGAEWTNVDHRPLKGIQEVVNIFSYPWVRSSNEDPWPANSIDEIWASHLAEHIPHDAELNGQAWQFPHLQQAAEIDGWFAWFYEAWRILKPGGFVHLVIPYPFGTGHWSDQTHRRFIGFGAFSYFEPNPEAPFDYGIPCQFEIDHGPVARMPDINRLRNDDDLKQVARVLTIINEAVVKSVDPDRAQDIKAILDDLGNTLMHLDAEERVMRAMRQFDGIDEFYIRLKAVK